LLLYHGLASSDEPTTEGLVTRKSSENFITRLKWRFEWLVYTCLETVAGYLPGWLVFRIGEIMGGMAWHLIPLRRRTVLRNLRIAFYGEHDLPTLQGMARETIIRTGANLFSAAHTALLPASRIHEVLSVENQELMEASLSISPGLVLLPSHMGNWEVLSRMNGMFPKDHKIGAFYRPLNNPILNERVVAQRTTDGSHLFSKRDSLHHVTGFLREGGIIGILADQRVGRQGELVRFFGRLTRASPLPSLMARRSKSAVLSMSLTTEIPGKWNVRYHSVSPPFKTTECMMAIEQAMKASPLDVFWLQERWRVSISSRYTIRDWLGPDACGEGKPHRALIWLVGVPESWQLPEEWKHPDVIYEIALAPNQVSPTWLTGSEITHRVTAGNQRALQKVIAAIDLTHTLPIDYIITCGASEVMTKAAQGEAIRIVSLVAP
jgi:Kdo2-lipid IVA lauroyltransferase/acyltransferase